MNLNHQLDIQERANLLHLIQKYPSKLSVESVVFDDDIYKLGEVELSVLTDGEWVGYDAKFSQGAYCSFLRNKGLLERHLTLRYVNDQYPESIKEETRQIDELGWDMVTDPSFLLEFDIDLDHNHNFKSFIIDKAMYVTELVYIGSDKEREQSKSK